MILNPGGLGLVLTLIWVSHTTALRLTQPYRVESLNGSARVRCLVHPWPAHLQLGSSGNRSPPPPDPEDLRVTLLRGLHGHQELCSTLLNHSQSPTSEEVVCWAKIRAGAVEVSVSGLRPSDTDMYRCDIQMFYPPPYLRLRGNGTLIHVVESSCPSGRAAARLGPQEEEEDDEEDDEEEDEDQTNGLVSVPVVVLIILIICVLIIVIYFQGSQRP
ncbi:cytotoxic T-lymphocyte protein 4 [Menidia menidia]